MKIIEISLENDNIWQLPLDVVAQHRAAYYHAKGDDFQEEYDFVMEDDYEGIDWLQNNMHLDDFKRHLTIIPGVKEVDWQNSEMCITTFLDLEIKDE